jgi:hypothetical protein
MILQECSRVAPSACGLGKERGTAPLSLTLACAAPPLPFLTQEQFGAEKEDLLDDYRQLTRDIKLKNLVIACFIPPEYQDQIMQQCRYDEYDQSWAIEFIECAGEGGLACSQQQRSNCVFRT